MSPEVAKMVVQLQANHDITHNYFCYDAFARIAWPKPLIPRISRGEGGGCTRRFISHCLVQGNNVILLG